MKAFGRPVFSGAPAGVNRRKSPGYQIPGATAAGICWRVRRPRFDLLGLRKLHDDRIDGQTIAGFGPKLLHRDVAVGLEDVLHLHGFDNGKRVSGFHLLPFFDRDGDHKAGHGAQQLLRRVRDFLLRHQRGELGLSGSVNVGCPAHSSIGKVVAVQHRPDLHEKFLVPDDLAMP